MRIKKNPAHAQFHQLVENVEGTVVYNRLRDAAYFLVSTRTTNENQTGTAMPSPQATSNVSKATKHKAEAARAAKAAKEANKVAAMSAKQQANHK